METTILKPRWRIHEHERNYESEIKTSIITWTITSTMAS